MWNVWYGTYSSEYVCACVCLCVFVSVFVCLFVSVSLASPGNALLSAGNTQGGLSVFDAVVHMWDDALTNDTALEKGTHTRMTFCVVVCTVPLVCGVSY